jgi:RimJ/RimL family protein N-acetyltransferase
MVSEQTDGDVLILRAWQKSDKDSLVRHANNRNVSRHLREVFPYPYTDQDADAWLNRTVPEEAAKWRFAIEIGGEAVGGIALDLCTDVERHSASIGYWLGEGFWGRGIMTHAVTEVTARALATPRFCRVCAQVSSGNPASMRVLEKAGYQREGVLVRGVIKSGMVFDQVLYAVTRDPGLPYEPAVSTGPEQLRC